jgi:hypothetical protein
VLPLESHSYNKSYPRPKAYYFSEIDDRKSFLVVWILSWLSLIVLAHRSLPTKCAHWFTSIIKPYHDNFANYFTLLVLMYRLFWVSTLRGIGPLSSRVVMISTVNSYIPPVLMPQRRSSLNAPMFDSAWKFLPMEDVALNHEMWGDSYSFLSSRSSWWPKKIE